MMNRLGTFLLLLAIVACDAFHMRRSVFSRSINTGTVLADTAKNSGSGFESIVSGFFSNFQNTKKTVSTTRTEVIIVGAGMAGLSCAKALVETGITDILLLESSDGVGGRVRTDEVDGYLLDRGFQVFIDSYPEAVATFDYKALQLKPFLPGAVVRFEDKFHLVSDPLRRPQDLGPTLISPIGTIIDKLLVGIFSLTIRLDSLSTVLSRPETTTAEYLSKQKGFSGSLIDRFFTPFYQGIYLSPLSVQSSRMFEFVFKMFTQGSATLPLNGMGAIPQQLADSLPDGVVKLNSNVQQISPSNSVEGGYEIEMTEGSAGKKVRFSCSQLVIATDPPAAKRLVNQFVSTAKVAEAVDIPASRGSTCLYFGFDGPPPVKDPILILNGENKLQIGPDGSSVEFQPTVNNVCFPSQVSERYAPAGKSLASVTIVGTDQSFSDEELCKGVKDQLVSWWGASVADWELLRVYRIPYAQPAQTPPYAIDGQSVQISNDNNECSLYCIGDHRDTATLNGAINSGKRAAALLCASLKSKL